MRHARALAALAVVAAAALAWVLFPNQPAVIPNPTYSPGYQPEQAPRRTVVTVTVTATPSEGNEHR